MALLTVLLVQRYSSTTSTVQWYVVIGVVIRAAKCPAACTRAGERCSVFDFIYEASASKGRYNNMSSSLLLRAVCCRLTLFVFCIVVDLCREIPPQYCFLGNSCVKSQMSRVEAKTHRASHAPKPTFSTASMDSACGNRQRHQPTTVSNAAFASR